MKKGIFFILCAQAGVLSFNVAAAAPLIPAVAKFFGLAQFSAGKIVWAYMLSYGVFSLLYGPLARVVDIKKVFIVCFFFFSLSNLAAGFADNAGILFFARILMGVFGSCVIPLSLITLAKSADKQRRGKFIGLFFSSTFFASLAGIFLSGVLPWRLIFVIPGLLGLGLCFFIYNYLPSFPAQSGNLRFNYRGAFRSKYLVNVFTYIFVVSLIYHGVQQWLSVYFSLSYGFKQAIISFLFTAGALSGIFGEALGGSLADKIGRLLTVRLGLILMITGVIPLLFKLPIVLLFMIMLTWGVGWTFNHSGLSTMLTDFPESLLNEAASLNSGIRFLAGGIGMLLSRNIMQADFRIGFAVFTACLFILLIFEKKLICPAGELMEDNYA